jgi:hypothetical protein
VGVRVTGAESKLFLKAKEPDRLLAKWRIPPAWAAAGTDFRRELGMTFAIVPGVPRNAAHEVIAPYPDQSQLGPTSSADRAQ